MTTQDLKTRYLSRAWVELCIIAVMALLCMHIVLAPMIVRMTTALAGTRQIEPARLYRLIERQHYSISPYDDVGLGDLDTPTYFVQVPPGSSSIRLLKDSDFLLIDRTRLDREFKESGRGSCASCPFRQRDVPFMSISVLVSAGNLADTLVIVGYERHGYSAGQWEFACFVFVVLLVYGYVLLLLLWNYSLRELAGAFVGLPLEDERRFLFPKRFTYDSIVSGPNGGWFYLGAYTLLLMTLPVGLAVKIVRSF